MAERSQTAGLRVCLGAQVHARDFGGELVILDLVRGKYFSLDEVGTRTWNALVTGATPSEVATLLADAYDAPYERIIRDVTALVDEMVEKGLLEIMATEAT